MRKKLIELLPEFLLISDGELREKTLRVWMEAMEKEGWKPEDLEQMPFTLLIEKTSINIIKHTRAVTQSALKIAEVIKEIYGESFAFNRDYLLSGALLHDIGKLFEYTREGRKFVKSENGKLTRHPISGAIFASRYELPSEVIHIIACHSKEGDAVKRTAEAVIVNHADFANFDIFME